MKQAAQEAYDNNNDPCIKTKSIASVYTTKREVSRGDLKNWFHKGF